MARLGGGGTRRRLFGQDELDRRRLTKGVLDRSRAPGTLITKHYFDIVAFVQPSEIGGPSLTDRADSLEGSASVEGLDSFRFLSLSTRRTTARFECLRDTISRKPSSLRDSGRESYQSTQALSARERIFCRGLLRVTHYTPISFNLVQQSILPFAGHTKGVS